MNMRSKTNRIVLVSVNGNNNQIIIGNVSSNNYNGNNNINSNATIEALLRQLEEKNNIIDKLLKIIENKCVV